MTEKEISIVKNYFKSHAFGMLKQPYGKLEYPFIDPGEQYGGDLWDWDSCFAAAALIDICEYFKNDGGFEYENKKAAVTAAAKGCALNFLSAQLADGFIPIVINNARLTDGQWADNHFKYNLDNQHKPFLCQSILQASKYSGDYAWFDSEKLFKYLDYYEREQFDARSGLYVFKSDIMIGIDNNPTVYGFPYGSTGDIYLNVFMYLELKAFCELLKIKGDGREKIYSDRAEKLRQTIINECYDPRDGLYYSVIINLGKNHTGEIHSGMPVFWKSLPIKLRFAACFLPMFAGISTSEQNAEMIERHYLDPAFLSPYGLRSTASDERVYCLKGTSNPSNSLGPIWLIYNYFAFYGLLNAGRRDLAEDLLGRILPLFAKDIETTGKTDECYSPDNGAPIMGKSFLSWNALIIKMIGEIQK